MDKLHALRVAGSLLNLPTFCKLLEWEIDDYSRNKFKEFQEATRLLGHFDPTTMSKLIEWGEEHAG
jgi:hypothetical protein